MTTTHQTVSAADVLVAGAGLIGVTAGLLLARAGHRVLLVDGDPTAPPGAPCWDGADWNRAGVRQFYQPHIMLPRWHAHLQIELPDVLEALSSAGAPRANLLHLNPDSVTRGWVAGDERFDTVAARRPLLESVLTELAAREPRLHILRPVRITGLLTTTQGRRLHIGGLRTTSGDLCAGLVVDALGRHTPVPHWLEQALARQLRAEQQASGFVYYIRQFRSRTGRVPRGHGPVLTHHGPLSVLTIPQDNGTYAVGLVGAAADRGTRTLRHEDAWTAAARQYPTSASWVANGTPISPIAPFATGADVHRRFVGSDGPVATGIVPLGDARVSTAPVLGRGSTLGLLQALVLRDVLSTRPDDPATLVDRIESGIGREIGPWVEASWSFAHHRAAEMQAAAAGTAYESDDPAWNGARALVAAAQRDPVLARCASAIGGLLDAPAALLGRPEVAARLHAAASGRAS